MEGRTRLLILLGVLVCTVTGALAARAGSPDEALYSQIAGDIAGRSVTVHCNDEASWAALAESRGINNYDGVAGFVPQENRSDIELAPVTCSSLDSYVAASPKPGLLCRVGTAVTSKKVRKRVRVHGRLVWRTVVVKRSVPIFSPCPEYPGYANAIHTLAHEPYHSAGLDDEGRVDCYALQTIATVAGRLGAGPQAARDLALYEWHRYVAAKPAPYYTPDCHDGGPLDLHPASNVWP